MRAPVCRAVSAPVGRELRRLRLLLRVQPCAAGAARPRGGLHDRARRARHVHRTGGRRDLPVDTCAFMSGCDFSLRHYGELLDAATAGGYRWAGFDHEPEPGDLFLRHDVDLSLSAALTMARLEHAHGA